jgi:uncharacterized membrane protein required for colicin V production
MWYILVSSKRLIMEIFGKANWVDLIVLIIMFRISYVASQDGLSHEIFPLIAVICSVVLSLGYYNNFAVFLSKSLFNFPIELANFLSFTILVIGIGFIFKIIRHILDKVIKVSWHPLVEKFGGLIAGIARASITTSIVVIIIALIPLSYITWSVRDKSLTGMYFLRIGPAIYEKAAGFVPLMKAEVQDSVVESIVKGKQAQQNTKKDKVPEWEKTLHQ